jgi:Aminoacyl-tRNA editing domain
MATPSTRMTLEELESMEKRMRRLLQTPAEPVPARVAASNRALPASRGERMFMTHQAADALIDALRSEHVPYELFPHRHTGTAMAEAKALHVEPDQVAKTLILRTPFGYVRAVLRALDRLDLEKARLALDAAEVELASEEDLVRAYQQFKPGAVSAARRSL